MDTTLVTVRMTAVLNPPGASAEECVSALESHLEALMDALMELEQVDPLINDPDIGATLTTGEVEVCCYVALPSVEAMTHALTFVRTAIHAAGDQTPGWETADVSGAFGYRARGAELVRT